MKKEESGALQGIAVLLMIFHHCFLYPSMFLDGFLRDPEFTTRLAASFRICIAICAFVSGYGIFHVLSRKDGYREEYPDMFRRIIRLYGRYWFAVTVTVIVELIVEESEFTWRELPGNLTAFDPTYNSTWWYVREYMFMLLLAPVIKSLLQGEKKRRLSLLIPLAVLIVLGGSLILIPGGRDMILSVREYVQMILIIVFSEGYLAAFIQDRLGSNGKQNHKEMSRGMMIATGIILTAVATAARFMLTTEAGDSKPDILIAPVFIYGCVVVLRSFPQVRKIFGFLGRNLLYMWFIHGLIWKHSFVFLTSRTLPIVYYAVVVISSLLASMIMSKAEEIVVKKASLIKHKQNGTEI